MRGVADPSTRFLATMTSQSGSTGPDSLQGFDIEAVRQNLSRLGHDVHPEQLVSMLESLVTPYRRTADSPGRLAGSGTRATDYADAGSQAQTVRGIGGNVSTSAQDRETVRRTIDFDAVSSGTAASSGGSQSSLEPSQQAMASPSGSGRSTLFSRRSALGSSRSGRESDRMSYTESWYCDDSASTRSSRSGRYRRAAATSGYISGEGASALSQSSTRSSYTAASQPLAPAAYAAVQVPLRPPQTDRVGKWSEYTAIWHADPFLRSSGDCKSSRRPKENFSEWFACEHALLQLEREAYIKGRVTSVYLSDEEDSLNI